MIKFKHALGFIFVLLASVSACTAMTMELSWETQQDPAVSGYKIYYGFSHRTSSCPPGGYAGFLDAGNTTHYRFENLADNVTYFFSITSYAAFRKESCFSLEAQKIKKSKKSAAVALRPPENFKAEVISPYRISLTWDYHPNNRAAFYKIYKDGRLISNTIVNTFLDLNYSTAAAITYAVSSCDISGNESGATTATARTEALNQADESYILEKGNKLAFANLPMPAKIEIFSEDGYQVLSEEINSPAYRLSAEHFASGIYRFKISAKNTAKSGLLKVNK